MNASLTTAGIAVDPTLSRFIDEEVLPEALPRRETLALQELARLCGKSAHTPIGSVAAA